MKGSCFAAQKRQRHRAPRAAVANERASRTGSSADGGSCTQTAGSANGMGSRWQLRQASDAGASADGGPWRSSKRSEAKRGEEDEVALMTRTQKDGGAEADGEYLMANTR